MWNLQKCSVFNVPIVCECWCLLLFYYQYGFCVWCCVLCIFVLALLYQSYGIFFFKFHTHEWFAFWYADKNIFCLSIDTKKHRHHQHYIHSMLFMLCKLYLYHFLLNWITLFFSLIILSQPSSRCPFSFLEFLLSFQMIVYWMRIFTQIIYFFQKKKTNNLANNLYILYDVNKGMNKKSNGWRELWNSLAQLLSQRIGLSAISSGWY